MFRRNFLIRCRIGEIKRLTKNTGYFSCEVNYRLSVASARWEINFRRPTWVDIYEDLKAEMRFDYQNVSSQLYIRDVEDCFDRLLNHIVSNASIFLCSSRA